MKPTLLESRLRSPMSFLAWRLARLFVALCLALLCIVLCSCKKDGLLQNEKQGKTDLSAFIFTEIVEYGGSNVPAARVSQSGITNYVYSEDKDGFQVLCPGNQIVALCGVFQTHFGIPVLSRTNSGGLALFAYTVNQTGLAINCALHGETNDCVTQLAVVKPSALR